MSTSATAPPATVKRSTSATRNKPSSRPLTPLRPSSRTSLRNSQCFTPNASSTYNSSFPVEILEPAFAELSDSMADLEANFMHLQLMNESLQRFNESFAGFLYGLNMNAFCVDFPEQPIPDSFKRARQQTSSQLDSFAQSPTRPQPRPDPGDETFMTSDTSFVTNTPASRLPTKFKDAVPAQGGQRPPTGQGGRGGFAAGTRSGRFGSGSGIGRGMAAGRGARGSGIARGQPRGTTR